MKIIKQCPEKEEKEVDFLLNFEVNTSNFHGLTKMHKSTQKFNGMQKMCES